MGFRFRKTMKVLPGVRVNFGLTRASVSMGRPGLTYNIGSKGSRVTVGLPGSGISYTHSISSASQPQAPVSFVSGAPTIQRRRVLSATPFVVIAFIAALLYLGWQSMTKAADPEPALIPLQHVGSVPKVALASDPPSPAKPTTMAPNTREGGGAPLKFVPQK